IALGMVNAGPLELTQTIVHASINVDDLQIALDQLDRRYELAALQSMQVKLVGMQVGSSNHHCSGFEEPLQQPPHQHRVCNVSDVKFVEAKQARFPGDLARNDRQWVLQPLMAVKPAMYFLHEAVKVNAALAGGRCTVEETVHQKALATSYTTPQV